MMAQEKKGSPARVVRQAANKGIEQK